MRAEHLLWLVVLLAMLVTLDDAPTWAAVFTPKGVAKMAAAGLILVRTSYVPPKDERS